jgi:uncharacterized membrane protein YfcA
MLYKIIAGLAAGILSGMGMGGGTILIPALVILFYTEQQVAQCTNLVFFVPTAIVALIIHFKKKMINIKKVYLLIIFGIVGAIIGSFIAINLSSEKLRKYYAIFLILIGLYEFFRKDRNRDKTT